MNEDQENATGTGPDPVKTIPPRRLPWEAPGLSGLPDAKPCYLSTDSPFGVLSRMADIAEEEQMEKGAEALEQAEAMLRKLGQGEVLAEYLVVRALRSVTQTLGDVLRVAECRGERLEHQDPPDDGDDGPALPAEAFG